MGTNIVGGTFLVAMASREGYLLNFLVYRFLYYLSLFQALVWGTELGTWGFLMCTLAEKAVSLLWSLRGTAQETFGAGRAMLVLPHMRPPSGQEAQRTGKWNSTGSFFAVLDPKRLKGHLKVGGSEGEENGANAG